MKTLNFWLLFSILVLFACADCADNPTTPLEPEPVSYTFLGGFQPVYEPAEKFDSDGPNLGSRWPMFWYPDYYGPDYNYHDGGGGMNRPEGRMYSPDKVPHYNDLGFIDGWYYRYSWGPSPFQWCEDLFGNRIDCWSEGS